VRPHGVGSWNGRGSAFLFHVSHAANTVMPALVAELSAALPSLVLVGASAWNAYIITPLLTEDLDCVAAGTAAELRAALGLALSRVAEAEHVCRALSVLEAVSALGPPAHRQHPLGEKDRVEEEEAATSELRDLHGRYTGCWQSVDVCCWLGRQLFVCTSPPGTQACMDMCLYSRPSAHSQLHAWQSRYLAPIQDGWQVSSRQSQPQAIRPP